MKRTILPIILLFGTALIVQDLKGQVSPSDDPSKWVHDPAPNSDMGLSVGGNGSRAACDTPKVSSDTTICMGDSVTLFAGNGTSYNWYDTSAAGTPLDTGDSFTTPPLNDTSSFYVENVCMGTDTNMMDVGTHSSTYSGNVRGYWFGAPMDFTIVGLRVPMDAATGGQNIEILRFDTAAPPEYNSTTNAFSSLGYWSGVGGTGMIDTNIQIYQGDTIGIYGNRDDINSYRIGGNYTTSIGGDSVVLTRSGMQNSLSGMQMQDVWSEDGGSISRVEMYYITDEDSSVRVMTTVNVEDCSVGMDDFSAQSGAFEVYPNPFTERIKVQGLESPENGELELLGVDGKLIMSLTPRSSNEELELEGLEAGIYFLRYFNENGSAVKKLIKE